MRLRLLQRGTQVLEVILLLGQEQLEQELRLGASSLLVQLPPLARAQGPAASSSPSTVSTSVMAWARLC